MRDNGDITLTPKALIGLLVALAGSNFVQLAYTQIKTDQSEVRPDPFTGTMGMAMEDRINRRIDTLEKRIDAIRADLNHALAHQGDSK